MMFHVIVFFFWFSHFLYGSKSKPGLFLQTSKTSSESLLHCLPNIFFCLILPCQHEFKPDYFAFHCFLFQIFPFSLWLKVEAGSLWADLKKNYHKKLTKKTSNVASPGVRRLLLLWNLVIVLVAKMCTGWFFNNKKSETFTQLRVSVWVWVTSSGPPSSSPDLQLPSSFRQSTFRMAVIDYQF